MFDEPRSDGIRVSGAQIETLGRVNQSFDVKNFEIRDLHGAHPDHEHLIAANGTVFNGGASWTGEWVVHPDGEVLSRAGAAAEPGEWLREGQEPV
jgi:hypothetical protein